ncbi:4-oxalocrotonate tautomerase [Solimonas aquatica]|uniref:Tautomerase n=1 Tax=Solimonas aquatica TaxID=489703 RepID=A0A1H9D2R8_9GAMM|nr:2-hydroxymuconate tautomerase family protein [Solimonas aquatica]SEQ07657.1 4-oxalocrotonate tautomerase [Solimonas aquatica]
MPIIKVEILEGRSREQKRELAQVLTRETARICACSEASIFVVIDDVKKENWAVGGTLLADKYPD